MHSPTRPALELSQLEYFAGTEERDGVFLATPISARIAQPLLRIEAG